jgi:hypothetical protein
VEADHGRALRVSRYFGRSNAERHVRFSVWNETGRAEAAVSLDDDESVRLAAFILTHTPPPPRARLLDAVRLLTGGSRRR